MLLKVHPVFVLLALSLSTFLPSGPTFAQADTTSFPAGNSPRGALWRAAVLPGWGQIYNRQYVKLPFVYASLGGVAALAFYNNHQYLLHRHAALYIQAETTLPDGTPNPYAGYQENYDRLTNRYGVGELDPATLRRIRDDYRRRRDLSYFGIGLVYGLTVLDAYVNAHLLDFDIDENLTLSLQPLPNGVSARLYLSR
jgi:hypothetical protein